MNLKKLEIRAQIDTPYISLDPLTGICEISGKSYPEDISSFYMQVIDWFEEYSYEGECDLVLNIRLSYFNSASQKVYTEIFEKLMEQKKFKITVNWYYTKEDDEILENGKIYEALTGLEFNYIVYTY
ncbi:MAG: DUF1987 domain-containing protein [Bacteroidales bacterium]